MKVHQIYSSHFAKRLAVPLLGIALTAGCSSSSDSAQENAISNDSVENDSLVSSSSGVRSDELDIEKLTAAIDGSGAVENRIEIALRDGVTTFPACESSETDPDGDGFGFENNVSCLVSTSASIGSPLPFGVITFPVCESSDSDPDGDGFGFENEVSCLVGSLVSEDMQSSDGVTAFPVCESSVTDPDGDGFGFENEVSCLVGSLVSEDMQSSDGVTAFPVCESSETDPDGDGFGFENNQSCLVASTDDEAPSDDNDPAAEDAVEPNPEDTQTADNPFFEDFSQPLPTFSQQDRTTEGATSEFTFGDGFAIIRVESSTDERERGRFVPRGRFDSYSAVMSIEPGSIALGEGRVQAITSATLFNDTSSAPQGADGGCVAGDIGVQSRLRLNSSGETFFVFNAFRETQSECGNSEDANLFDGMTYVAMDVGPELGVSYRLGIEIDRDNKLLTLSIDDQSFTYQLLTDVYQPGNPFSSFESRIERGPGTAVVRFDEISVDGQAYDFSNPDLLGRFTLRDAGDAGTDVSYPNGELRLESVSTGDPVDNRLGVTGHHTRYASAQLRLSSESIAADAGEARARIGGSMYYASDTAGDNSSLDQVFAITEIRLLESGATEARYCAWQSLDDSFTESVSLINPDNESGCELFTLTPVLDQNYTVATYMDDANRRIVFSIDGEEHFHNVEGPISIGDELFEMRIQSRATGDGSRAVVFADNLESAPGAAP